MVGRIGIWRRGSGVAAAVLVLATAAYGQSSRSLGSKIDKQKAQLRKIQEDINQHRRESQTLGQKEKNIVRQLSSLDKEISLSKRLLAGIEEREQLLEEQIDSLHAGIDYEETMLQYRRDALERRLRQMYKRGQGYRWQMIMASASVQEAMRRFKFFGILAERDASLIEEVSAHKLELESEQAALTEAMADVVALKEQWGEETQRLKKNKKRRVSMLGRVRSEKSKHLQAIEELKKSQEKLKDVIGELERKRLAAGRGGLAAGEFAKLKGKLIWPVKGKVTRRFGSDRHPKFGTVTFNNGINIEAAPGAPIRAVAGGKVEFVDWITGYGNCIILNHGGGYYTLYAHAAQIFVAPGQNISGGEVIAEVGDSGSLNGFECHFEIRKSKEALNPADWLAR